MNNKILFLLLFFSVTNNSKILAVTNNLIKVSFHQSMSNAYDYNQNYCTENESWKKIKERYDTIFFSHFIASENPRIPKIIHRIWIGSPQPPIQQELEKSWIEHHPDWEYKLWTDQDIAEFGLKNQALYDKTTNYGEKSDIARYEILYRYGGLYIDTDFECCKSFDIFHHCCDFYTGLGYFHNKVGIFNGLIGAAPNHPILEECINNMTRNNNDGDTFYEIQDRSGPYFFTRCFLQGLEKNPLTVALPLTYFYPWPNEYRHLNRRDQIISWLKPETFAIHHWHVSWNNGKTS